MPRQEDDYDPYNNPLSLESVGRQSNFPIDDDLEGISPNPPPLTRSRYMTTQERADLASFLPRHSDVPTPNIPTPNIPPPFPRIPPPPRIPISREEQEEQNKNLPDFMSNQAGGRRYKRKSSRKNKRKTKRNKKRHTKRRKY